ncbi:MAG: indole-3-glycerol phosphate synthase TrpC [Proteobacteria bacterium]|jgi:indole-3-glycerol phosphate synthase|nr:indole-3-glycerol phosphate synthase TrpC [Pseudomonadota bacterium]
MDLLSRIIKSKREEIAELKGSQPLSELKAMIADFPRPLGLAEAVRQNPPGIIAEIKRRSPSAGEFRSDLDQDEFIRLSRFYQAGGAAAISILTEKAFFGGSLGDLAAVKMEVRLPLLMKDFILDEYQLYLGRLMGADSVLLIVKILNNSRLGKFIGLARELGFEPLVEVHDEEEVERAVRAGAVLIGINNRDLQTLKTDLEVTRRLFTRVPTDRLVISESGIKTREEIESLWGLGVRGFLIGESLLKTRDPTQKLRELTGVKMVS